MSMNDNNRADGNGNDDLGFQFHLGSNNANDRRRLQEAHRQQLNRFRASVGMSVRGGSNSNRSVFIPPHLPARTSVRHAPPHAQAPPPPGPPTALPRVTFSTTVFPTTPEYLQARYAVIQLATSKGLFADNVHQIQQPAARDAVQAALYRYLTVESGTEHVHLERAASIMQAYSRSEQLVILELAVWKATCILQMRFAEKGDYFATVEWIASGWKCCKEEQRGSQAASIIVAAVQQYLE